MEAQSEIFVSYAWKGESEVLVDHLCGIFSTRGYTIIRDKSTLDYKDSIKQFMERIGQGRYIIAVVNDKYMKSEYCMYEAYRMFQSPAFRKRVFPIVLPDADIFSFSGQAAYLKHWDQTYKQLEAEYREIAVSSPTMIGPLTERLRDIETTTRFINDFMAVVGDMNVLTSEMHLSSDFQELTSIIEARIEASDVVSSMVQPTTKQVSESVAPPAAGSVTIGNISGVSGGQINIAGRDIQQMVTETGTNQAEEISIDRLLELLERINLALPDSGLDRDEMEEVINDLERVLSQTEKTKPNHNIIIGRLRSAVDFLANSSTISTTAPQLIEWGQQALAWARQLYK